MKCDADPTKEKIKVDSYTHVPEKDADQLKAAIEKGPVCVSVDASSNQFMQYHSGILISNDCGGATPELDHAVTAVGYGKNLIGQGYFIVRNSWGTNWGEHGYIRMSSDIGGNGVCGILMDSNIPFTE